MHLTHGERTPTYLGVERIKTACRYGATPLYYYTELIRPVMEIGDAVVKWTLQLFGVRMTGAWLETGEEIIETRAQLCTAWTRSWRRGTSEERHEEIVGALDAGQIPVGSVMVDRENVVFLSTELSRRRTSSE